MKKNQWERLRSVNVTFKTDCILSKKEHKFTQARIIDNLLCIINHPESVDLCRSAGQDFARQESLSRKHSRCVGYYRLESAISLIWRLNPRPDVLIFPHDSANNPLHVYCIYLPSSSVTGGIKVDSGKRSVKMLRFTSHCRFLSRDGISLRAFASGIRIVSH